MVRIFLYSCIAVVFTSCLPLSFAPNIKTDKVKLAKRFKRDLPRQYAFIFEDPKEADEFFTFINTKYKLPGIDQRIPLWVDKKPLLLNIYERKRISTTLNFVPVLIDAVLSAKKDNSSNFLNSFYTTRKEKWFIIITLTDLNGKDALAPTHSQQMTNLSFLRALQKEYINTANYMEAYFRKMD